MKSRQFCAALAALVLVNLAAAETRLEPPDLDRYLKWGPLRVRPGLTVTDLGYDDNILFATEEEESDLRATVSPQVDGLVLFGSRAFLTFRERFDFTAYRDNRNQNFVNQRGVTRLTLPLRKIGFFATGNFERTESRPVDLEAERVKRDLGGFGLGVIVQAGWRTEVELEWKLRDLQHSDPKTGRMQTAIRLDRVEQGSSVSVNYKLRGRTRLTLDFERKDLDFDSLFSSGGTVFDRDSRRWTLMPGLDLGDQGRLRGSLQVGWAGIEAGDPQLSDLSEPVGKLELAYRGNSRMTLKLNAERQPGFALYDVNTYYVEGSWGARAVYFIHRAVGIEAGAEWGRLTFPDASDGPDREDRTQLAEIGLRLRMFENGIGRRVEYSLTVGKNRRDSNLPEFDRTKNTVSFGAVVGF